MSTAVARASNERYREASYDPFENDMGENSLQRFISELFRPLVEEYLAERQGPTFVGADQYVGWDPDDGEKVLAPDVYVLPGVEPGADFEFWKVWQTEIVPSFALEIVSKRKKKDYTEVPPLYDELGVGELVIFDPRYKRRRREAYRFQVYRRIERRGFVRVEATNADRVRSRVLGCWIRCLGEGEKQRLRLAEGLAGDVLVPTATERSAKAALAEGHKAGLAEGHKTGVAEGHKTGVAEGLRQAVRDLCEVLGIAVPADREAALHAMASEELAALRDHLKRERRWPREV
jgi:Uma2 family endonuclease